MTPLQSVSLVIFAVIFYMILVDENVAIYINLLTKIARINIERFFWTIKLHPIWYDNFFTKRQNEKKYAKIIEELISEKSSKQ